MFNSLLNSLFIKFWSGRKRIGPDGKILLTKRCESYIDTVYDLKWTLEYLSGKGKKPHIVTISERASKWNLRRVIRRIEKTKLPKEIDALVSRHSHAEELSPRTHNTQR